MENNEEYEHLPSEFYYPEEHLHVDKNSNETCWGKPHDWKSGRNSELFKSAEKSQYFKKNMADINTLACYMKEIGKNVKVENLPTTLLDLDLELDHGRVILEYLATNLHILPTL